MKELKLEDLVEGKKYRINKPADEEEYPHWDDDISDCTPDGVFTYSKSDNTVYTTSGYEDCIYVGNWVVSPSWLSPVEGGGEQPIDPLAVERGGADIPAGTLTKLLSPEVEYNTEEHEDVDKKKHNHYYKPCPYEYVDIYRLIEMFEITDPCIQHAFKKLAVSGGRGHKNIDHDVQDVIDTLQRWQEMREEEE